MKIGVTERGDAGLDFSWVNKLCPANIIISKEVNDRLIEELIRNKDKIIFHATMTGYGGTELEPNVPKWQDNSYKLVELVNRGFPVEQVVLRIDPIIPTEEGIELVEEILTFFVGGIKRVRFSFLDMYPHVRQRFLNAKVLLPYSDFQAPEYMQKRALKMLEKWEDKFEFESCAEKTKYAVGCISQKDIDILGIKEKVIPSGYQRKGCLCAAGKTELLNNKHRCAHQCLYCYWKD